MMSLDEIKKEREIIMDEIERLKGLIDIEKAKLKALQRRCKHPNMKTYTSFGDVESHCKDCGLGG